MASSLPAAGQCCTPVCDSPTGPAVPGPAGEAGAAGAAGDDGANAFTTFTAAFTIPAELGSAVATVADTSWMGVNQILYGAKTDGSVMAYLQVTAVGGATAVTLKNIEDAATSAYAPNSAPGAILTIGSTLSPAGIQGPAGTTSGAAGGDLKGTYPNPKIAVNNTLGSLLVGNGTDAVSVPAGTNGHMLAYDSTDAEGVKSLAALPLTGGTDVSDNRIARLDGTTGLPIPMQSSKVTITDNGAVRADGSGGNTRGLDAVDLQVNRTGVTQVASGDESFLGGGDGNTVSGNRASCVGGDANIVSSTEGFIGGGEANQAITGDRATVCGGQNNVSSGTEAFIGGGQDNVASNSHCAICGGDGNDATGQDAFVGGGQSNIASGDFSAVPGGLSNLASGLRSGVLSGWLNTASGNYSSVAGGKDALADKYGQMSRSSGMFAAQGDAQVMELILRNSTTDATPTELFLDGATLRAAVPVGASWIFSMLMVVRRSTGTTSIYKSEGQISNVAGTTAVAGVTTTELNDGIGLPATPVVVDADDPNDALRITCTGIVATIRWVAHLRIVQVIH